MASELQLFAGTSVRADVRKDIMKDGDGGASKVSWFPNRNPGDVLAGQPAVVIPLNRAVVCGEDHVYDVGQFSVCPNCAAEERLQLIDLLAHKNRTLVSISR